MDRSTSAKRLSRNPHVPNALNDMILRGSGLRWHGPAYVVGAPRRSLGYAFVAPPSIRGRGIRNAVCPHSSATC